MRRARRDRRGVRRSTPTIRACASSGVRTTLVFRWLPTPRSRSRAASIVALLDHDDELTPDALAEVVRLDQRASRRGGDLLRRGQARTRRHSGVTRAFKPDWSPDLFLHRMYTCHLTVVRKEVFESAGGFRTGYEGAQDYDLLLRVMERTRPHRPHPPDPLSLAKVAAVDGERRSGEAVGDGCRAAARSRTTSPAAGSTRKCCRAARRVCSG